MLLESLFQVSSNTNVFTTIYLAFQNISVVHFYIMTPPHSVETPRGTPSLVVCIIFLVLFLQCVHREALGLYESEVVETINPS